MAELEKYRAKLKELLERYAQLAAGDEVETQMVINRHDRVFSDSYVGTIVVIQRIGERDDGIHEVIPAR